MNSGLGGILVAIVIGLEEHLAAAIAYSDDTTHEDLKNAVRELDFIKLEEGFILSVRLSGVLSRSSDRVSSYEGHGGLWEVQAAGVRSGMQILVKNLDGTVCHVALSRLAV